MTLEGTIQVPNGENALSGRRGTVAAQANRHETVMAWGRNFRFLYTVEQYRKLTVSVWQFQNWVFTGLIQQHLVCTAVAL
jgi:hypothetical protein